MLSVDKTKKRKKLVPPGLEPGTFRVLSERDNHYTTELTSYRKGPTLPTICLFLHSNGKKYDKSKSRSINR